MDRGEIIFFDAAGMAEQRTLTIAGPSDKKTRRSYTKNESCDQTGSVSPTWKHPCMEQLHKEFRELRRKGVKVKGWWFKVHAKSILESTNPDVTFKYSEGWFTGFKNRYKISFRRPTNTAQKAPTDKEEVIHQG